MNRPLPAIPVAIFKVPAATKDKIKELSQLLCVLPSEPTQLNKVQHQRLLTELYVLCDPITILALTLESQGHGLPDMPVTGISAKKSIEQQEEEAERNPDSETTSMKEWSGTP